MTGIEIPLLVMGAVFYVASFFIAEKLGPRELNKIGEMSNREIRKVMERELQKVTADIANRVEEKADEALAASESSLDSQCNDKIRTISEYSDTVIESINKSHNEVMFLYSMLNDKHVELTQFSSKLQELAGTLEKHELEMSKYLAQKSALDEARAVRAAGISAKEAKPASLTRIVREAKPVRAAEEDLETKDGKAGKAKKDSKDKKAKKAALKPEAEEMAEPLEEERIEDSWPDEDLSDMTDSNYNAAILALHKEGKSAMDIARELVLGLGEVQLVIGLYEGNKKQ